MAAKAWNVHDAGVLMSKHIKKAIIFMLKMHRVILIVATLAILGSLINANDATDAPSRMLGGSEAPRLESAAIFRAPTIDANVVANVESSVLTSQRTSSAALTEALMELEKANLLVTSIMTSKKATPATTTTKKRKKRRTRPTKNPLVTNQFRLDVHFDEKDGFGTLPFAPTTMTMTMTTTTTVTVKPVKPYPKGKVYGHYLDALGLLATLLRY